MIFRRAKFFFLGLLYDNKIACYIVIYATHFVKIGKV